MRVLLVSEDIPYPNMGGLAKHVLNLAHALVRAGHVVDLLGGDQHPLEAAGDEGKFGGRFFGELNGHLAGWKEIQLGLYLPPKRTWLARRFARIIMRHAPDYDVVHYHGHVPNVALFIPEDVNFVQTRHDHGSECLAHTRFRDDAICESIDAADLMLPQRTARPAFDAGIAPAPAAAASTAGAPAAPPPSPGSGVALDDYISNLERNAIMKALEESRYNKTAAAKKLGITFRALRYKLKKLGID